MPSCLGFLTLVAFAAVAPDLAQTAAPIARATGTGETTVVLDPFAVQSSAYHGNTATRSATGTRIAADIKSKGGEVSPGGGAGAARDRRVVRALRSRAGACHAAVAKIEAEFSPINILLNNAGMKHLPAIDMLA